MNLVSESEIANRPFHRLQLKSTAAGYAKVLTRIIAMAIRSLGGNQAEYLMPLSSTQRAAVDDLVKSLRHKHDPQAPIQKVLFEIFARKSDGPLFSCPLLRFIICANIDQDGRVVHARQISPLLSQVQYGMQMTVYKQVLEAQTAHVDGPLGLVTCPQGDVVVLIAKCFLIVPVKNCEYGSQKAKCRLSILSENSCISLPLPPTKPHRFRGSCG